MATLEIKDTKGKKAGTVKVADAVFAIEPNTHVMHQVVRSQMAARRSGTHDTKTRGLVRGGGAKPYRQKGTGRARAGSSRSPLWVGGGVIFGPHPRSYAFKVPNKMVKLAMRSALSDKTSSGVLYIVDAFGFEKPSTKAGAEVIKALGLEGTKVTVVVASDDANAVLSLRNLPKVRVITTNDANTYDLVDNAAIVLTKPALEYLEGVLA
jgi:large subunit ribosomal protein L4